MKLLLIAAVLTTISILLINKPHNFLIYAAIFTGYSIIVYAVKHVLKQRQKLQ